MCFPYVSVKDMPVFYIGIIANGKKKEYNFDLAPFIK